MKIYLRTRWLSLVQVALGAFAFSFIFASIPIFQEMARSASYKFELERNATEALSVQVLLPNRPLGIQWYFEADEAVRDSVDNTIASFVSTIHTYGTIQSAYVVVESEELQVTPSSPQALLQFFEGLEDHVQIVEGTWPFAESTSSRDIPLAIGRDSADLLGVDVGTRISVIPDPDNGERKLSGVIRAVLEVRDEADIYWMGYDRLTPYPVGSGMRSYMVIPVTLGLNDFLGHIGLELAPITANYWWYGVIDKAVLEKIESHVPPEEIKKFESQLNQRYSRGSVFSSLDLLNEVTVARDNAVRLALYVGVAAVVSFSAVYFLVLGSTLSIREFKDHRKLFDRGMPWKRVLLPSIAVNILMFALSLTIGIVAAATFVPEFLASKFRDSLNMDIVEPGGLGLAFLWSLVGLGAGMILFVVPFVLRTLETVFGQNNRATRSLPMYVPIGIIIAGSALSLHGVTSGIDSSENFLASNIALILAPAMLLVGASGLCAQLVEFLADVVRIRAGSTMPQRFFIVLAMLKTNARSTVPLLTLGTLAIMVLTLNVGLAASVGVVWNVDLSGDTSIAGLQDPVIETILNAFVMGCFVVIAVVSTVGIGTVTTNAMRERRQFVESINALGYSIKSAWRLALVETIAPISLSMAVGFVIARTLSKELSPLLWPLAKSSPVGVIPDSAISVQTILAMMVTIEIGLVAVFIFALRFGTRGSTIAKVPEGITRV